MIDVTIHNAGTWWSVETWLPLLASAVALLSVILSHRHNKRQLDTTNALALKQIYAAAEETSKKLRAEVLLKEKQTWISEFRETIIEILYLADPHLDGLKDVTLVKRFRTFMQLGYKINLMLPAHVVNANLIALINSLSDLLLNSEIASTEAERLEKIYQIQKLAREIILVEKSGIESCL